MKAIAVAISFAFAWAVAGCAVRAPALSPSHPARASAPAGRLAGAPASLRPGVVAYPDVPPLSADDEGGGHHQHHQHPP